MPPLTTADRETVSANFQENLSIKREGVSTLTKADILAAVNGLDDWITANQAAVNQAIPLPARNALTASQKNDLFTRISGKRYQTGV